jgi:hypothetical protein
VGGISLFEINLLEKYYLELIDHNLYISTEEFSKYLTGLQNHFQEINRV